MSRNFIYRSTADGIYFRVDKLYRARKIDSTLRAPMKFRWSCGSLGSGERVRAKRRFRSLRANASSFGQRRQ